VLGEMVLACPNIKKEYPPRVEKVRVRPVSKMIIWSANKPLFLEKAWDPCTHWARVGLISEIAADAFHLEPVTCGL
jgi:hypothetical protein